MRQVDLGPPPEGARCSPRVERAPLEEAEPWRVVGHLRSDPRGLGAALPELTHRRLDPRADVEDAAVGAGRRDEGPHDVLHEDVVARLAPVSEDRRGRAVADPREEDRDDARLPVRVLAGPVDVAEAERDVARPIQPVPGGEVLLGRELRGAVRGDGTTLSRLGRGVLALAVDRPARRGEDHLCVVLTRELEHTQRAEHVGGRVGDWVGDRAADVDLRGEVEDDLGARVCQRVGERAADVEELEPRLATTCSRRPELRSSTTCTSSPRSTSASTSVEPMNPAPPVTTARTAVSYALMFVSFEGLDGTAR